METSNNEPSVQTPVATQADGAIPTKVEASAATQAESILNFMGLLIERSPQ